MSRKKFGFPWIACSFLWKTHNRCAESREYRPVFIAYFRLDNKESRLPAPFAEAARKINYDRAWTIAVPLGMLQELYSEFSSDSLID